MEKKKINFNNIKGMLSKDQMKKIKGGSTPITCGSGCHDPQTFALGYCGTYTTINGNQCVCYVSGGWRETSDCYLH